MSYSEAHRDNIILPAKWKEETKEAGFFDIRYKGEKWTQDMIIKDGELSIDFERWLTKLIKSKGFDWREFCDTNEIFMMADIEDGSKDVIKFEDRFIYLTDDGVIGIRYKRLWLTWTTKVDKKKGTYWYNDFKVMGNKKDGLWFTIGERKQSLDNYDFNEKVFTEK